MGHVLVDLHMAFKALAGTGRVGLRTGWRHTDLMHKMTGCARDPLGGMLGLLPVDELLVMALGKLIGIDMFDIAGGTQLFWGREEGKSEISIRLP